MTSCISFVREAIIRQGLKIYSQPIFALQHYGCPIAYREILTRIETISHQVITPEMFGLQEKLELLREIDYWVIATFFHYLKTTADKSSYSINLCAENLASHEFTKFLLAQATQVAASDKLRIDVLGIWATDLNQLRHNITVLQRRGFQFGLDVSVEDRALTELVETIPWNYLEFSITMTEKFSDTEFHMPINVVSDVAKKHNVKTVAKRVSQTEIPTLLEAGINYVQGFEFGRPELLTQVKG